MHRLVFAGLFATAAAVVPAAKADTQQIDARCQDSWPGNFDMQLFCRDNEVEGALDVSQFLEGHGLRGLGSDAVLRKIDEGDPHAQIYIHCLSEWNDDFGAHFSMMAFCISTQLEALDQLTR